MNNLDLAVQMATRGDEEGAAVEYLARHIEALHGRVRTAGDGADCLPALEVLDAAPEMVAQIVAEHPILDDAIGEVRRWEWGPTAPEFHINADIILGPEAWARFAELIEGAEP